MIKKFFVLVILMLALVLECYSQAGSTGWWIMRRPQSTKPREVTAVASVRGDLSGVFYNPSILGTVTQKEVFLITETGLGNDNFGGLLYGMPLGKRGGFSAGIIYYDAGRTTLYWMESGVEQERTVTAQKDTMIIVSYGKELSRFDLGASIKYATSEIAETKSAGAFAIDLGFLMYPTDKLSISVAGQNLGSGTKFIEQADELPTSLWLGGSYTFSKNFNSGVDLAYILKEERMIPSIGLEYLVGSMSLNVGYRFNVEEGALHIGIGMTTKSVDFGFAYLPSTSLNPTYRLSLGWRF